MNQIYEHEQQNYLFMYVIFTKLNNKTDKEQNHLWSNYRYVNLRAQYKPFEKT